MKRYAFLPFAIIISFLAGVIRAEPKQMQILGWWGIPSNLVTGARYAEARDMGMTILTQWTPDVQTARRCLDIAQSVGLKLSIHMKALFDESSCEAVAHALKDHPALSMYHIADEPNIPLFSKIGTIVRKLNAIDPNHEPYVNLLNCVGVNPRYWYGGVETYPEYLKAFLDEVPVKSLSFDKYPIIARTFYPKDRPIRTCDAGYVIKTNWYETLEACLHECKTRKMPMYAFALSCAHRIGGRHDFPEPQVSHIMLQHNVNLAYGAQLLQYFVYWPILGSPMDFQAQPFTNERPHLRTAIFDRVRKANQLIQARAFVFAGCVVKSVRHTGNPIPVGTTRLTPVDLPSWVTSLDTPDGGAVVSHITNRGTEFIVVVNRSIEKELTLKIALAPGTKRVRDDGSIVDESLYSGEYWLEPGTMEIFCKYTNQCKGKTRAGPVPRSTHRTTASSFATSRSALPTKSLPSSTSCRDP